MHTHQVTETRLRAFLRQWTRGALKLSMVLSTWLWMACGSPYTVIHQAQPNPFLGTKNFVVKSIDFSQLRIGVRTETQYVADKSERQDGSFEGDKQAMNEVFYRTLRATAAENELRVDRADAKPSDAFVIIPIITFIEPGFYAAVAQTPSKVVMTLKIVSPNGNDLDEIEVSHSSGSSPASPSSGQRLRNDAAAIGETIANYVTARAHGN